MTVLHTNPLDPHASTHPSTHHVAWTDRAARQGRTMRRCCDACVTVGLQHCQDCLAAWPERDAVVPPRMREQARRAEANTPPARTRGHPRDLAGQPPSTRQEGRTSVWSSHRAHSASGHAAQAAGPRAGGAVPDADDSDATCVDTDIESDFDVDDVEVPPVLRSQDAASAAASRELEMLAWWDEQYHHQEQVIVSQLKPLASMVGTVSPGSALSTNLYCQIISCSLAGLRENFGRGYEERMQDARRRHSRLSSSQRRSAHDGGERG